MRITEQILAVSDYGKEEEDVLACFDGMDDARDEARDLLEFGPITLCRVKIIAVEEIITE